VSSLFLLHFQKRGCVDTISNEFQFEEVTIPLNSGVVNRVYKYNINNNIMCLGVRADCDDATVYLINDTEWNGRHRRNCYFQVLHV